MIKLFILNKQSSDFVKFVLRKVTFNKKNVVKLTNTKRYNKFEVKLFKLKWLNHITEFLPCSVYIFKYVNIIKIM